MDPDDLPADLQGVPVQLSLKRSIKLVEEVLHKDDGLHPTHGKNLMEWMVRKSGEETKALHLNTLAKAPSHARVLELKNHRQKLLEEDDKKRRINQLATEKNSGSAPKSEPARYVSGGRLSSLVAAKEATAPERGRGAKRAKQQASSGSGNPSAVAQHQQPRSEASPPSLIPTTPIRGRGRSPGQTQLRPRGGAPTAVRSTAAISRSRSGQQENGAAVFGRRGAGTEPSGVVDVMRTTPRRRADAGAPASLAACQEGVDPLVIGEGRKGSCGRVLKSLDIMSVVCCSEDPGRELFATENRLKEFKAMKMKPILEISQEEAFQENTLAARVWMIATISQAKRAALTKAFDQLQTIPGFVMPAIARIEYASKTASDLAIEENWTKWKECLEPPESDDDWNPRVPTFPVLAGLSPANLERFRKAWQEGALHNSVLNAVTDATADDWDKFRKLSDVFLANDCVGGLTELDSEDVFTPVLRFFLACRAVLDPIPGAAGSTLDDVNFVFPSKNTRAKSPSLPASRAETTSSGAVTLP